MLLICQTILLEHARCYYHPKEKSFEFKTINTFQCIKNVLNIGQPVNLPWNIKLELLNRNTNITTLRIRKRQETGYFMTINEVMEVFQLKYKEEIKKRQHIIKYVTVVNVNF